MNKPNPNKAIVIPMGRKTRRTSKPKKTIVKPTWAPVTTTNVRYDAWGLAMQTLWENGKL